MWPKSVLMVSPDYFNVEYQINPHMVDANGELNKVDQAKAMQQWLQLKTIFENLNLNVEFIDGAKGLPDMVFCANQTFPFNKDGLKSVVLSHMHSRFRQPEVEHFSTWARSKNWRVYHLTTQQPFEGMGDALWNYETGEIFGGYGFRTQKEIYTELEKLTGQKIIRLHLVSDKFYHLDTCLSILSKDTAAYVPEAFDQTSRDILAKKFANLIEVPTAEALQFLACNCCTPNGKDVIIQEGADETIAKLKEAGFNVIPVDTTEFIKSGGSVFCMKQLLF